MTATFYFHVADGDLRAEHAGDNVRIVVGNFGWTILLEDRLDCARWMKALTDAEALFMRKATGDDSNIRHAGEVIASLPLEVNEAGYPTGNFPDDDLEPLPPPPPLPQRKPARPPAAALPAPGEQCCIRCERAGPDDPCRGCYCHEPPPARPWQAAMDAELSPQALAGGVPLATLAPEPQEDEAEE